MNQILNIVHIDDELCKNLEFLFTDIDDTITTDGMMPPETLEYIWKLHRSGIKIVLVTGRPAGWCDYFARMWPVAGIIGENGAFYFNYDRVKNKMNRIFLMSDAQRRQGMERLEKIRTRVLQEVPQCGISADQPFRISDLAIDFCEDVPHLDKASINKLCRIIEEEGAEYKVSSIHINCWYGEYNKLICFDRYLKDQTGATLDEMQDKVLYIGDSPNDEPMFKELRNTVAVQNIVNFLDQLEFSPAFISSGESGLGFVEIVDTILKKRKIK